MKLVSVTLASIVVALFGGASPSQARVLESMTCRQLFSGSDLIVVATPASRTRDTAEKTQFPDDICTVHGTGPCTRLPAIGVETQFHVVQVLKGERPLNAFTLHHFREPAPAPDPSTGRTPIEISGPLTVSFDPAASGERQAYLLFLAKEADGRYAPYGGQTDPALYSIFNVARLARSPIASAMEEPRLADCDFLGDQPLCRLDIPESATAECGPR